MRAPADEREALDLIHSMESYYRAAFDQFDVDDMFYDGNLEQFIEAPEEFPVTVPPTGRSIVDEATDNVVSYDMQVSYKPRGNTERAKEDAELIRQFLKNMWIHWRSRNADIDPQRDFVKNLFKHGKAIWKVAPDWTLWPRLDAETERRLLDEGGRGAVKRRAQLIRQLRSQHFPVFCRSIHPKCIMEDPTIGQRKLWVIERYEGTPEDVRSLYAHAGDEFARFDNWSVGYTIHEVWTATHFDERGDLIEGRHWVFVNHEVVIDEENPYGDLPYVWKHGGMGRESYESKPENKAVGFYNQQVKSMLLAEARRFTHFDAIMTQLAWPVALVPQRINMSAFSLAPGAINQVPDDLFLNMDKIWLRAPIPQPEYLASLNVIAAQIERGTTQRAIRGVHVPGTDSAAQLAQIMAQARLRLDAVKQAVEEAVAEVNAKVLRYIDTILEDEVAVPVAEEKTERIVLGPKNIRGRYVNGVSFMPNEEQLKERKLILAADAMVKGAMSRYDAYVYAGFDDVQGMIARRQADELMQEPLIKRAIAKQVLEDWGIDVQEIELQEQVEMAEAQVRLRDAANALQAGAMRGVGDVDSPNGAPLPGAAIRAGQAPEAALAQFGAPPSPQSVPGRPPMAPAASEVAGLVESIRKLNEGV